MDYIDNNMTSINYLAHFKSKGWNMSFTDGSVQFSKPDPTTLGLILAGGRPSSIDDLNIAFLPVLENNAK